MKIQTVLGEISPQELGVTYDHEHLLFMPPEPFSTQDPDLRLDSVEAAVREANFFKQAGGQAIVEMSTVEMGRDPRGMRQISEQVGIHIIAATGFNKGKFCESVVGNKGVEELASRMVQDLTVGMDETHIRAGLIKISTSKDEVSPVEDRIIAAALIAHQRTGAPVSTHTEAGTLAMLQVERLISGGVNPSHIIIGHLDRKLEWDYLSEIAAMGVFMGFDQVSKEKYYPDAQRIEIIKRLIEAGHGGQILLSGDLARKSYWPSFGFGHGPGLTYILWRLVPWMLEEGISRDAVNQMLIDNPARAFTWAN